MSVFVHRIYDEVSYGEHHHLRGDAAGGDERTWAFDCPACEERILSDTEFTARTPGGVPLTHEEKASQENLERAANKDVSRMAMALAALVKDQVTDAA